ncbi:hypothetical protein GP486_003605 [Trichoglossum hirsutum]|uniref:Uncharacterized protein n=1 Tax=Trichoglossum hirsutum TaxID=265104 RepID=A0A9P8RQY7_9PEZI|nr:hypothetical protein GP486_003605 [Trichoglossum hirsutum]
MPGVPSEQSIASESTARSPVPMVRWRVALPKHGTVADLYFLEFRTSDSAERIFKALRDIYDKDMSTYVTRFLHFSVFLRKTVIETAGFETVSPLRPISPMYCRFTQFIPHAHHMLTRLERQIDTTELESQLAQVKVHLTASNISQLFTDAFHNPTLYRQSNFASSYPQFSVASGTTGGDLQTLVVRNVADKPRLFRVITLAAPMIGALVGAFSGRADVGIGVTTAIFAFVTCLQVSVH